MQIVTQRTFIIQSTNSTGKSIPLSAYFKNSDYKKVISKEILIQMKAEMKKDTNKVYWCQKNDNPRFKGISKNQSYYINKQGRTCHLL